MLAMIHIRALKRYSNVHSNCTASLIKGCHYWYYNALLVAQLVKALCYKPVGRGSIPDGVIGIFHLPNPSGRTIALGLTQSLTEMGTRNISWGVEPDGV